MIVVAAVGNATVSLMAAVPLKPWIVRPSDAL
jgi:hypothetical protein